jgi:fructokinase
MEPDALVVGESLVDIVRTPAGEPTEVPGGSAANAAVALARLDRPVRLATSFADDEHGALVRRHLEEAGVRLAADPYVVARTSTAVATIGSGGAADYEFDVDWRLGEVPLDPPPAVVHTSSLAAVVAPGAEQVVALLGTVRERSIVSYDVNARPAVTGTGAAVVQQVERVAELADLVKASDEDLSELYPPLDVVTAARRLLSLGPLAVVVTRGAAGAVWVGADDVVEVDALRVEVVDTIGAGDTFGAALLDSLWAAGRLDATRRGDLRSLSAREREDHLRHAARAAAVTVSRPGADPPYRSEL